MEGVLYRLRNAAGKGLIFDHGKLYFFYQEN